LHAIDMEMTSLQDWIDGWPPPMPLKTDDSRFCSIAIRDGS
jgi:hypothetical protein